MNELIYCPVRKEWVAAFPEEIIRQSILRLMFESLGFPDTLVAVEKSLRQLPHIPPEETRLMPNRRADIICFAKDIHPKWELYPLLIIECKAVKLNSKVISQITGYNHFVRAFFVGIANAEEMRIGWHDVHKREYAFISRLPSYKDLIDSISIQPSPQGGVA